MKITKGSNSKDMKQSHTDRLMNGRTNRRITRRLNAPPKKFEDHKNKVCEPLL